MTAAADVAAWFAARVPPGWFEGPLEVRVDRDEVLVVGPLDVPGAEGPRAVEIAVQGFREGTRDARTSIALEAERLFERKVSWGVEVDGRRLLFSHLALPVMTRLRMAERSVLDVLVDASVARSRADALAWCVRLVGRHEADWIAELREALVTVAQVRDAGPGATG
jgi:hypothetical protein